MTSAQLDAASHRRPAALHTISNSNTGQDVKMKTLIYSNRLMLMVRKSGTWSISLPMTMLIDPGTVVQLDPDAEAAICHSCLLRASHVKDSPENCITMVESLSMSITAFLDSCIHESHQGLPVLSMFHFETPAFKK